MTIVQWDGGAANIDHQAWSYYVVFNMHTRTGYQLPRIFFGY
jgi:hypothetical protein